MSKSADILITGGKLVVPVSREGADNGIAIEGGQIIDIDLTSELKDKFDAKKKIDATGKIVMPGLTDGHIHTAQIMLRGSINDRLASLPPVWLNYLIPFENRLTESEVKISSLFSALNMIKSGVTSFVEAGGPCPSKISEATKESGLRGIITKSTIDRHPETPMYQETAEIIEEYGQLMEEWSGEPSRITVWPSLREIMLNSLDLYDGLFDLAEKYDSGVTMHLAESRTEVEFCLENYGKRPVELMYVEGYLNEKVLTAYMIFLSDKELGNVADAGNKVAWCPAVDAFVMGPPRVGELLERGVKVVLGSDGGEWNNMDLYEQARLGRTSIKLKSNSLYHDKIGIDNEQTLRMLTKYGENIFREPIGSLEEGYRADIIILSPETNLIPGYNTRISLVNMAGSQNIETTIVDGEILMEDGELNTLEEDLLVSRVKDLGEKLETTIKELKSGLV